MVNTKCVTVFLVFLIATSAVAIQQEEISYFGLLLSNLNRFYGNIISPVLILVPEMMVIPSAVFIFWSLIQYLLLFYSA